MEFRRVQSGIASGSASLRIAVIIVAVGLKRCDFTPDV
jgi:hypothetical protein